MAEGGSVSLNIKQDSSQLLKMYRETTKVLGQISFFKEKITRGEKFSNKEIKEAHKALQKQLTLEEKSLAVLERTARTLKTITAERQKIGKTNPQPGTVDYQRYIKTRETENRLRGTQNLLRGETRAARSAAGGLSVPEEEKPNLLQKTASMFDPETAAIMAAIAFATAGAKKGWGMQKGLRDYSLMASPGELGGLRRNPVTGKMEPYGRYTTGTTIMEDAREEGQNRWTGRFDSDFDRSRRLQERFELRKTGAAVSESEAADALAMSKLGFSQEQIQGWRGTAVRGGQDIGTRNRDMKYNDLRQVFADAVQLGFTGLRTGEYMDTIRELNESSQKTAGNTDPEEFRQTMKEINSVGSAAFMGSRGGQVAQVLQNSLLNPGGGVAGKLLMLRAGGFKGNYAQTMMQLEQGLTPQNLAGLKSQFMDQAKVDPYGAALGFSRVTGLSIIKSFEMLTGRYAKTKNKILPPGKAKLLSQPSGMSPQDMADKISSTQGGSVASAAGYDYATVSSGVEEFTTQVTNAAKALNDFSSKLMGFDTSKSLLGIDG